MTTYYVVFNEHGEHLFSTPCEDVLESCLFDIDPDIKVTIKQVESTTWPNPKEVLNETSRQD